SAPRPSIPARRPRVAPTSARVATSVSRPRPPRGGGRRRSAMISPLAASPPVEFQPRCPGARRGKNPPMSLQAAPDHLKHGRRAKARDIVHGDESPLACWTHAVVHLQEGDLDNARYWFGRADRPFSRDIPGELAALAEAVGAIVTR